MAFILFNSVKELKISNLTSTAHFCIFTIYAKFDKRTCQEILICLERFINQHLFDSHWLENNVYFYIAAPLNLLDRFYVQGVMMAQKQYIMLKLQVFGIYLKKKNFFYLISPKILRKSYPLLKIISSRLRCKMKTKLGPLINRLHRMCVIESDLLCPLLFNVPAFYDLSNILLLFKKF